MKNKFVIFFILAAFLISAWGPLPANTNLATVNSVAQPAATTLTLVVNNKTGQTFPLTLQGPASYRWTVTPGKSNHEVAPGKYKYTYQACGGSKSGTVEVKKDNQNLTLAVCKQKSGSATANVKITNDTGGTITINLTGPATYRFSFGPGKSTMSVIRGKYSFTVYGCGGGTVSGVKNLTSRLTWRFWCS